MSEEYLPYGKDKVGRGIWECLKRMYKEAEPSGDIDKIAKSGEGKMPDFFMAYYLPSHRETEIIEEVCKEFKIKGWDKRKLSNTLWMGSAPTSAKERFQEERKDYDKKLKEFLKQRKVGERRT